MLLDRFPKCGSTPFHTADSSCLMPNRNEPKATWHRYTLSYAVSPGRNTTWLHFHQEVLLMLHLIKRATALLCFLSLGLTLSAPAAAASDATVEAEVMAHIHRRY